jgi:hypothetical protein
MSEQLESSSINNDVRSQNKKQKIGKKTMQDENYKNQESKRVLTNLKQRRE